MSGVWEGLLSVQDSGCPQNITHAGQGTEASQDQVIHCASRERDRDTGKTRPKTTTVKEQPKTSSSQLSEAERSASVGILLKDKIFHQPVLKGIMPK